MKQSSTWRLILSSPLSGAENMAIDEALLQSFEPGRSLPTLRLYGWSPPALSLGRFQQGGEALDLNRCRTQAVPIVRRITGGGVIYHADELTYSLVCSPEQIPPASSVKDSFRVLTGFLLVFYRRLGLKAAYAVDTVPEGTRLGERTPFCFAGRETFDILIGGRKIGGNAQRRMRERIFQHGSIPLLDRAGIGLSYMREATPALATGATSLGECGITIGVADLQAVLSECFAWHFGVDLRPLPLSAEEQVLATELKLGKYARDDWNLEGREG